MIIKTRSEFDIVDYVVAVEAIASEYFDDNGNYTPHIGAMNAMRIFYNDYVTETDIDIPHDIVEATNMEVFINDSDFVDAFNNAIKGDGKVRLDFANAYKNALDIVEVKKNSLNMAIMSAKKILLDVIDKLSLTLTDENIEKFSQIAKEIADGKLSSQAIADAVGNSEFMQQIAEKSESE